MRAGRLRHRVAYQDVTIGEPTDGGHAEIWTTTFTGWASIVPATALAVERSALTQIQAPLTHLVTLRYRPGVQVTGRFVWTDPQGLAHRLAVRGVQNVEFRGRELVAACEERV